MHEREDIDPELTRPRLRQADLRDGLAVVSRQSAPRGDWSAFLRGFLRCPGRVASVVPSSGRLEQRLVRCALAGDADVVLELGPGTGGTSRALLAAMRGDARLLAIEIEPAFQAHLCRNIRDPRFAAHLGSAEDIEQALLAHGLQAPQAIVSGIPFSTMPLEAADRIAAAIGRALAPGGRFVAYQVRAHVAGCASPYLGPPQRQWEWINLPPVRVFTWTKSRAAPGRQAMPGGTA